MCCDATHVVRRGCSRSYLACCTCISAWQKCPIEPLGKESGWLLWRATELRTPFFFRPLNGHIFWNRAEKKWYTFLCTNGRFRIYIYMYILDYVYVSHRYPHWVGRIPTLRLREAFEQEQNRVGVSLGQAGELSPCGEIMGKPPENLQMVSFPHRTLSLEGK